MGIADLEKARAIKQGVYDTNPNCPDCGNKVYQNELERPKDHWWCPKCQRYAGKRVTVRGHQHLIYYGRGDMSLQPPKNAK